MTAARVFLGLVGGLYVLLAAWCSLRPEATARAVGLRLQAGGGQSEFLTVYGGLELGLGLLFLWPIIRPEAAPLVLGACLVIHGCLVLFRAVSFLLYPGIPAATWALAALEWGIVLGGAAAAWRLRP